MTNSFRKNVQPYRKRNRNQARGQTKFKTAASRKFRRLGKQRIAAAAYDTAPRSLIEVSNLWNSPSDGFFFNADNRVAK